MDVQELYYKISREDTFTTQATMFGHDVNLSVRNITEIRAMLNPPRLLRDKVYHQNRISFEPISFELVAYSDVHGLRMPTSPYKLLDSLRKAVYELLKDCRHGNYPQSMDAATFNFLGVELCVVSYDVHVTMDTINISAAATHRIPKLNT